MARPKRSAALRAEEEAQKLAKLVVAVGDDIPEFDLEIDESVKKDTKTFSSKAAVEKSGLVIFFYPKANTGGCTNQAVGFKESYDKFKQLGYEVVGMSADKPKSQANWKAKHSLPYNLVSDTTHEVMQKFGVSKGNKITRSHVVIEKGGKIKAICIGVSPKDSPVDALKTVEASASAAGAPAASGANGHTEETKEAQDEAVVDKANEHEEETKEAEEIAEGEANGEAEETKEAEEKAATDVPASETKDVDGAEQQPADVNGTDSKAEPMEDVKATEETGVEAAKDEAKPADPETTAPTAAAANPEA